MFIQPGEARYALDNSVFSDSTAIQTMLTNRERLRKISKALRNRLFVRSPQTTPVFIFGEMRSGTNMLTDCLDLCPATDIYNETDDDAFDDYELRDLETIRSLCMRTSATHAVFKAIADSNRADEILGFLESARAVWIYRRYQDVVNSALAQWHQHNEYLRLIIEEPDKARWRRRNLASEQLDMIGYHRSRGLSEASARALIWYLRNDAVFRQGLDGNSNVLLVNYEQVASQPETCIRAVFDFVGLPFRGSYVRQVSSTSVRKRPQPEIDREVEALCESLMMRMNEQCSSAANRSV